LPKKLTAPQGSKQPNVQDLILASDPYFLKHYEKARRSPGVSLAELKKSLHAQVPGRGKRARTAANRKA
jgi:hypothetical protein